MKKEAGKNRKPSNIPLDLNRDAGSETFARALHGWSLEALVVVADVPICAE